MSGYAIAGVLALAAAGSVLPLVMANSPTGVYAALYPPGTDPVRAMAWAAEIPGWRLLGVGANWPLTVLVVYLPGRHPTLPGAVVLPAASLAPCATVLSAS